MISIGADVIIVTNLRMPITFLSLHHITGHVFCIHAFFRVGVFWNNSGKSTSRMSDR